MTVEWMWSGAVTDTGARVKTKVTGSSQRLAVADNSAMSSPTFFGPVSPDVTGVATLDATGLTPDRQWWYQIEDDSVIDTAFIGRFHTFGTAGEPYVFTFGTASCAGAGTSFPADAGALEPTRISNHPVFDEIRTADPLFFCHTGDRDYYNYGDGNFVPDGSVATYRTGYDDLLTKCPRQAELYRNVPLAYVWDDHDYGPNNSDGTHPDKANAAQVYRERFPHYPLVEATGSIYHSFQVGRVLFVMLDSRYNRQAPTDPEPRTYLGSAQLAWLDGLLAAPPAGTAFVVVASPQPFMSGGSTSWGSYTQERDQIYQMVGDHGWIGRMLTVSGDQHQLGWDSGSNTAGFPLYVMGPLDSNPGVAGTAYDLGTRAERGQYGLIKIRDYGGPVGVVTKGFVTDV